MTDPYAAIAEAFPASVTVDRFPHEVRFRIAGQSRKAVLAEILRVRLLVEAHGGAWLRLLGPFQWAEGWICHGVLRPSLRPQKGPHGPEDGRTAILRGAG